MNIQITLKKYERLIRPVLTYYKSREAFYKGRERHSNMADNPKDFFENELWYEQTFKPFKYVQEQNVDQHRL